MQKNYRNAVLAAEALRRARARNQIKQIVKAHFRTDHPRLAVKRGKVYDVVSRVLGVPNSTPFKRMVRQTLLELGIRAVCVHKTYLFRGLSDQAAIDAWEVHEREKAARKAARLAAQLSSDSGLSKVTKPASQPV